MKIRKKGQFFSIDAFLAATLLITALVLLIDTSYIKTGDNLEISYASNDIINAFSNIRISEVNNSYIKELMNNGMINNTNNSILEQIGEFYVLNLTDYAFNLTYEVSHFLIPEKYGFSIIVNSEEIYNNAVALSSDLVTSRRLISGIEKYKPIRGATSKVYLEGINTKRDSIYLYFGGFIGQGNISVFTDKLPSDVISLDSLYFEYASPGNFSLYVNDVFCGFFNSSPDDMTPNKETLDTSCRDELVLGTRNNFSINFDGELKDSYISGGFLRMDFLTDKMSYYSDNTIIRYNFPSVEGIINMYDSIYTPGDVNSMNLYLHYNSSEYTYVNVGGANIYVNNANGTETFVNLTNANISGLLSYNFISNKTVPLRLASYNITYALSEISNADVVIITDFSGSMKKNFWTTGPGNNNYDCPSILEDYDVRRYQHAKCLDSQFLDIIFNETLNITGGRVWPITMYDDNIDSYSNNPSDPGLINNFIMNTNSGKGKTCLACTLNAAYDIFAANNESGRQRFIVFMTDGVPTNIPGDGVFGISDVFGNEECEGYCDTTGNCNSGPYEGCSIGDTSCDNAVISSKNALNRSVIDFNVSMYAIGFGDMETYCPNAVNFLGELANLTYNGSFNVSNNLDNLLDIYRGIAFDILEKTEQEAQLVNVTGNYTLGKIYQDSYIEFNITPNFNPPGFGEIELSLEEPLSSCSDTINIPNEIRIIEGVVTSYSGIHWTHNASLNGNPSFRLKDFSVYYNRLGDPFNIYIPQNHINSGNNIIDVILADNSNNLSSNCSTSNSFIYKGAVTAEVSYSEVLAKVVGCNWTIDYDNGGSGNFVVPPDYSGTKQCFYTTGLISYDENDTYDDAMFNLMNQLDFDDNGEIFVDLGANDLIVNSISILRIPYPWGPTIAEVRIWK